MAANSGGTEPRVQVGNGMLQVPAVENLPDDEYATYIRQTPFRDAEKRELLETDKRRQTFLAIYRRHLVAECRKVAASTQLRERKSIFLSDRVNSVVAEFSGSFFRSWFMQR